MNCEECKFWNRESLHEAAEWAVCDEIKDALVFECDDPGIIVAEVETPKDFGCILAEEKK